jgi:1,4-dihydroxy-2-naphthoate octaprenyltransferase
MKAKLYFLETRPQFLVLSVVLTFLGTSIAWYYGFFNLADAILAGVGLILAHASCNTLNDYFDYTSGIDRVTNRTPFSGGSGMLREGLLQPKEVLRIGIVCLALDIPVGIYFIIVKGWLLLPLILFAAFCILFYSPAILKTHWPEWSPMLGLGAVPVLGLYVAQTGAFSIPAIMAAMPSGFLVHNLLLLNEFPDVEADKIAGRKTLPITIGRHGAAIVYTVFTALVYVWIAVAVVLKMMPAFCLIAFLTAPLAIKAIRGSFQYGDMSKLVPAMANNGIGYVLAGVFHV